MTDEGLNKKVGHSLKWLAASKFASQLVSWAATIVTVRLLAPEDYGIMAVVTILTGFFGILSELGLGVAVIREPEIDERKLSVVFGALCLMGMFFCALLFAASPLIAAFYHEDRLTPLVRAMSAQFLISSTYIIPYSLLQRQMSFKSVALIDTTVAVLASLTTLVLAWKGFSYWSLALGSLAEGFLKALLANAAARHLVAPRLALREARAVLGFGGNVALSRLVWYFMTQADTIIASRLLGAESLGLYTVSMTLANIPVSKVMGITNQIALPAFASIQDKPGEVKSRLAHAVRLLALAMFPVLWGLSSVSEELVQVLLADKWAGAAVPLLLVPLVLPLRVVTNTVGTVVISLGRADSELKGNVRNSLVMICAFLIGAQWGIRGFCYAWIVGLPIAHALNFHRWLPLLGMRFGEIARAAGGPAFAAAVMYAGVFLARAALRQAEAGGLAEVCASVAGGADLCQTLPGPLEISVLPRLAILISTGAITYLGIAWWTMREDVNRALRML